MQLRKSSLSPFWLSHNTQLSNACKHFFKIISNFHPILVCILWLVLALLRVVRTTWTWPHFLWWGGDEEKTRVTFRHLFVVVHVSPLSLPHWRRSVVRVGGLVLWPGRLVPEPTASVVLVSGRTKTTAPASGVATSVSSPVRGADAWHVGPLGHYLQVKEDFYSNV